MWRAAKNPTCTVHHNQVFGKPACFMDPSGTDRFPEYFIRLVNILIIRIGDLQMPAKEYLWLSKDDCQNVEMQADICRSG